MDDLITWLCAQLDKEERVARDSDPRRHREIVTDALARPGMGVHHNARHIANFDPARVLAEVDAKRRILDMHQPERVGVFVDLWCQQCQRKEDPCPTLRLLALPYAAQPGYQQEWAP